MTVIEQNKNLIYNVIQKSNPILRNRSTFNKSISCWYPSNDSIITDKTTTRLVNGDKEISIMNNIKRNDPREGQSSVQAKVTHKEK